MNNSHATQIFKSLADDMRLAIVRTLADNHCEESSSSIVHDCAASLQLSQPTMSHHFNKLVQAGVLYERKAGTEKFYRLNYDLLMSVGIDPTKI
jgi:DNA-binding transcriptional ArsR family regulator